MRVHKTPIMRGPSKGPNNSADSRVRRSRRFSTNSLAKTLKTACTSAHPFGIAQHLQKRLFQRSGAAPLPNRVHAGIREHFSAADDHDSIAERPDLLHDVRGEQHAAALGLQ